MQIRDSDAEKLQALEVATAGGHNSMILGSV